MLTSDHDFGPEPIQPGGDHRTVWSEIVRGVTSDSDVARDWWLGAALATHDGEQSDSELRKVLTSDHDFGPEPIQPVGDHRKVRSEILR